MSNSLCKSSVSKTYQEVISDVITNVRELFIEDGVDETVLQELKTLWETKLSATKAVEDAKEVDKIIAANRAQKVQQSTQQNILNQLVQQQNSISQPVGQVPPNNHIPQGIAFPEWRRVPVKLTIPSPSGCNPDEKRILSIEVPEVFLQDHHLKSIITGPIISATLNLPLDAATAFLQDQVNNAFLKHQQSTNFVNINMGINPAILQADGHYNEMDNAGFQNSYRLKRNRLEEQFKARKKNRSYTESDQVNLVPFNKYQSTDISNVPSTSRAVFCQEDGAHDSSDDDTLDDDDDDNDNEDDDDDDANLVDIEDNNQEATEDEPLNSEDDVSDADGTEQSFDTDNVMVCQFDKITRARNRWKFHLKDGIMNVNGQDYVFQKANGDAEW